MSILRKLVAACILTGGFMPFYLSGQLLPLDKDVTYGRLDNGLTYYIRQNESAPGNVNFYFVQKTGSLNEEENERGIAHFIEHLAFDGSKNFPGQGVREFVLRNGLDFGRDLNALTSYEKTIYRIENVPSRSEVVDSCLLILHDWGSGLLLEDRAIEMEKKVITEEWRSSRGLDRRLMEEIISMLFPEGNLYASRAPIGSIAIVNSADSEIIRGFYEKWYRPELQAIIVTGDINPAKTEAVIKEMWSDVEASKVRQTIPEVTVFLPDDITVAVVTDPALSRSSVELKYIYDPFPREERNSELSLHDKILKRLVSLLIDSRLKKLLNLKRGAMSNVRATDGNFSVTSVKRNLSVSGNVVEGEWRGALKWLAGEMERIRLFGFDSEELEQNRNRLLRIAESNRSMAVKRSNEELAMVYADNFLFNEPASDPAVIADATVSFLDTLSLNRVNEEAARLLDKKGKNLAIVMRLAGGNEKMPEKEEVVAIFEESVNSNVQPLSRPEPEKEVTLDNEIPLIAEKPVKGSVVKQEIDSLVNCEVWTLSNGLRIYLMPDDKTDGNIMFSAISKGGYSVYPGKEYPDYSVLNAVGSLILPGRKSRDEIAGALKGKNIGYSLSVDALSESVDAMSSTEDFETLLQLIYLVFGDVRIDNTRSESWRSGYRNDLVSRERNPYSQFGDSILALKYGHDNVAAHVPSPELADKVNFGRVNEMLREKFGNAGDFDFIITGGFDKNDQEFRDLIETYIASIPVKNLSEENYATENLPVSLAGEQYLKFRTALTIPAALVLYNIETDKIDYSQENIIGLKALSRILDERLIKELREVMGVVYNVNVSADIVRAPANTVNLNVNFMCAEENVDIAADRVKEVIERLAVDGLSKGEINTAKEFLKKNYDSMPQNASFNMKLLKDYLLFGSVYGLDFRESLENVDVEMLKGLLDEIKRSDKKVTVVMLPPK